MMKEIGFLGKVLAVMARGKEGVFWVGRKGGEAIGRAGLLDRWLHIAVLAGAIFGMQGFLWGRYDCLNLDRMALRNMYPPDYPAFHPRGFVKPPFYTYWNHFFAQVPAEYLSKKSSWLSGTERRELFLRLRVFFARAWNLLFFAGTTVMIFWLGRAYYGLMSARMMALLWATSAGLVPYQIFLTTDLALLCAMLGSFVCAARIAREPGLWVSLAGGLLAGVAAATKYNGLAVAAALPLAHLMASKGNPFWDALRRPSAWLCGLAVPIGFILGNPYSVLDAKKFADDFYYNYTTTPVYGGQDAAGTGYGLFFRAFFEIFGIPGTIAIGLLAVVTVVWLFSRKRKESDAWKLAGLAAGVFVLYAWKIGAFPRMETRFVLPVASYALLFAGAGFVFLERWKKAVFSVLAVLVCYNAVCAVLVGRLFWNDPRMKIFAVLESDPRKDLRIEASRSIPQVKQIASKKYRVTLQPAGIERVQNFRKMFGENEKMAQMIGEFETTEGVEWYSLEKRRERNPDWILWSTADLEDLVRPEYTALFAEGTGYEVIFDEEGPEMPAWAYPKQTEFLRNRTTVWCRSPRTP